MPDVARQNPLKDLNPIQKQAVLSTEGPSLILAGAGSGKTKVLTHRVAYLIKERAVSAESILCITFTNKAAREMMGRIINLIGIQSRPVMGTFHSVCARVLRKDGKFIGLPPSFSIYDETDAIDAIKQAMAALNIAAQKMSPSSVKNTISGAKNEMITALEYPRYARGYFQETVAKIYLEYQKILEKNQAVDFDDLMILTVKLFQNNPEVLSRYQIQFKYILIDEYQDTNAVQYLLSKLLANRHKNISVVGDASQSIYSFRGADFRNIVNFQKDYPQSKVFNLEQNYRSTQTILDAAYAVISKNRSHPILKLWTDNPSGTKVQIAETRDESEEAFFIVKTISDLMKSSNQPIQSLSDFAILYRTNAQSRSLEEVFLKMGVPYVLVGGIRFYERKEIKDILAYLRLIINPEDSVSKSRIEKIGKGRALKFFNLAEQLKPALSTLTTLEILDQVIEITSYLDYVDDGTEVGKSKVENVKELRSVAEQFNDITAFLENVTLVESEYTSDEKIKKAQKDAVTLTTLHQAKGLEWQVVFMVGMEEGLFPHSRSLLNPDEMEEERRLCYVGITRAKQQLYLTHTRQRLYFGTRSNNLISRFVIDLPSELVDSNSNYQNPDSYRSKLVQSDDDDWLNI